MNEMELVEDFCAAEPPPSPQRLATARATVAASIGDPELAGRAPAGRWVQGPGRTRVLSWPRLAIPGAVAGAVAIATAVAIVVAATVTGSGASRPPGGGTAGTRLAAYVLDRAATAALAQPEPADGQFIYTSSKTVDSGRTGRAAFRVQTWLSVDGQKASATRWSHCMDVRQPSCLLEIQSGTNMPGYIPDRTYAVLRTLPTDPGTLLSYLEQHSTCLQPPGFGMKMSSYDAAYAEIYMILTSVLVLPPKFGAALFAAAAKIPGVTVLPHVVDAAGGQGIAVAMTYATGDATYSPQVRHELIFDPHSYRFVGAQSIIARAAVGWPAGELLDSTALLSSAIVNSAPTDYTTSENPKGGPKGRSRAYAMTVTCVM